MKNKKASIEEEIKKLPLSPGVYIFKSIKAEIVYIGKASLLRKRVRSHFSSKSLKRDIFLQRVDKIEHIQTDTQEQALILEASLIKEKKPKYNISLRDDKSYPYVEITKEDFPRIFISRPKKTDKKVNLKKGILLGPYTATGILKLALNLIRRVFPYRSCKTMPKTPCLFFHLNLCPAPCVKNISAWEYSQTIKNITKVLKGERQELILMLEKRMNSFASKMKFEEAARIRDQLSAVYNLYWGKRSTNELVSLKKVLGLDRLPLMIEAIDISSLSGRQATGSVVVFRQGMPDKSNYRRFKIKVVKGIDDYAMMAEVVKRRYSRLIREEIKLPDLVIVDGGKGHVQRVKEELDNLGIRIPLIGIAKKNEEIWFAQKNNPLIISKDNPCLHLIQRIRDEAHRFAKKYHKVLRKKIISGK